MSATITTTRSCFVWCAATMALCGWNATARAATVHWTGTNQTASFANEDSRAHRSGPPLTSELIGVTELNGAADSNGHSIFAPPHLSEVNVISGGSMNVSSNTHIEGGLRIAADAQVNVRPALPYYNNLAFDVAGPISNAGTFSIASVFRSDVTVRPGAGQNFTNEATGTLTGRGIIDGSVVNYGVVRPERSEGVVPPPVGDGSLVPLDSELESIIGSPADGINFGDVGTRLLILYIPSGAMKVTGDYQQDRDATLAFEITDMTYFSDIGQLDVGGAVELDGRMEVTLGDGFVPRAGDTFDLITAGEGLSGRFAETMLPGLPAGMSWKVLYGDAGVSLMAVGHSIPEPASSALLMLGLVGMGLRRRQRSRVVEIY